MWLRGKIYVGLGITPVVLRLHREENMGLQRVAVVSVALFLISTSVFAGPKEDVAAATAKWGDTLVV